MREIQLLPKSSWKIWSVYTYILYVFNTKKHDRLYTPHLIVNFHIFVCGHWFTIYHDIIKNELLGDFTKSFNIRNAFMFLVLQIPAFHVPGFTDSGFSCSWFYRFRLFMFLVFSFLVPFLVPFPDSPFLVLQIATVAAPLTQLTTKEYQNKCSWTEECDKSSTKLKDLLCSAPVLRYSSKALSPRERNYSTTEKEAFAIQFGSQHFRVYLVGRKFTIIMDHNALKWLNQIEPKGRVARWLMDLQEFDFIVKYKSGRVHNNADALSRLLPCQHQVNNKPSADVTLETLRNKILV